MLRQLRVTLHPELRSASIHLAPAELGRVSIRLEVEGGRVRAELRAESPETLALLERHVPELAAAFEGQGLEAEGFDLGLGFERGDHFARPDGARASVAAVEPETSVALDAAELARAVARASGLDTYA
ncbi:MAG: flagellar hook-length control protein FliK [Planctomycetes bacterium]|nr:flagellar hook-length control protein FliK [Planctomycetota bacterium]